MKKNLFALINGDCIEYTIGIFKGHVFRIYPNGNITKANAQEEEIAKKYIK